VWWCLDGWCQLMPCAPIQSAEGFEGLRGLDAPRTGELAKRRRAKRCREIELLQTIDRVLIQVRAADDRIFRCCSSHASVRVKVNSTSPRW
jgi:hypothetical protein